MNVIYFVQVMVVGMQVPVSGLDGSLEVSTAALLHYR